MYRIGVDMLNLIYVSMYIVYIYQKLTSNNHIAQDSGQLICIKKYHNSIILTCYSGESE